MDREKLVHASEKTACFFESQLDVTGRLKEEGVCGDIAAQYKLPTLLLLTGRTHHAHLLLDNIKKNFMQTDGDFISYPDKKGLERKTDDPALCNYWPYINGWIAMAAQRLGRFDISVPARDYLERFYNPSLKGYGISIENLETKRPLDIDMFMSSHLGLLSLYCGDVTKAKEIGECLEQFVAKQPDLSQNFFLKIAATTGEVVTQFPDDHASFYRVNRTEKNQLHFLLGYPVFFLYFLELATGDKKYIALAEKILGFQLKCDDSMYNFVFSHKAAFGAGVLFKATGKAEYRDMCQRIVSHLVTLQKSEGYFVEDFPLLGRLDQSAEIGVWFRELANYVFC